MSETISKSVGLHRSLSPNKKFFDLIVNFMKSSSSAKKDESKTMSNEVNNKSTNKSEDSILKTTEDKLASTVVDNIDTSSRKRSLFSNYIKGTSSVTPHKSTLYKF